MKTSKTNRFKIALVIGLMFIAAIAWSQSLPWQGGTGTRTQFTAGSVVFACSTGVVGSYCQDNANFSYDATGHILTALGGLTTTGAVGGTGATHSGASITLTGAASAATYATATNCASSASPAVCASSSAGSVAGAASSTTLTINTTAVTTNSEILITEDSSLGTRLSVTCNTTPSTNGITVTTRTAATSFAVLFSSPTTNPRCFSWRIVN